MTFFAVNLGVFALQPEGGKIVVEVGGLPAFGGVATLAFRAIGSSMRVVLLMT